MISTKVQKSIDFNRSSGFSKTEYLMRNITPHF